MSCYVIAFISHAVNFIPLLQVERDKDGSWIKLHDELHSLHSSPNIVRVIKSRRMRWAGHVTRMGRGEVFTGFR
jgi:hypothetical protein